VLTLPLIEKSSRRGHLARRAPAAGSLADLLIEKGAQHERNCLQNSKTMGEASTRCRDEIPTRRSCGGSNRIGNPMQDGHDVIYQMPLVHEGIRGIADFLIRKEGVEGYCSYEPVDAKLTRIEGKPDTSCNSASTPTPSRP